MDLKEITDDMVILCEDPSTTHTTMDGDREEAEVRHALRQLFGRMDR